MSSEGAVNPRRSGLTVRPAQPADRESIYRLRHDVYARELGQHPVNPSGRLCDPLDEFNHYLVAEGRRGLAGFVSVTPPGGAYSIDKYLERRELPFTVDDRLYEIRLLTVPALERGGALAAVLMFAALRWVEERGGTHVVCIGRREVLRLYRHAGLQGTGIEVRAGAVRFELLHSSVAALSAQLDAHRALVRRIERRVDWQLGFPVRRPAACFHGGAFFEAIGESFAALERRRDVINADVLDAWFPPAPRVLAALRRHLDWLSRTSPPTAARGLVETIARVRGVEPECVLPGAGSSALIYLAFGRWLGKASRALLLEPTYGEYAHVLEQVVGCRVDRLRLRRESGYRVPLDELAAAVARGYDLVVLVNPNSPTGQHVDRVALADVLERVPAATRIWIDETYGEYVGPEQSLEALASRSPNIAVCKSMSKVYALSGMRVAYLCAAPAALAGLRAWTPPWAVGLPAQVAAVEALQAPEYYRARYAQTHRLRELLQSGLRRLGLDPLPARANFLLVHLPPAAPPASSLLARCRARDLYLRDPGCLAPRLRDRAFRIAVKDAATTARMLAILGEELAALAGADPAIGRQAHAP